MIESPQELLRQLRAQGLVADGPAVDEAASPARDRPWYIGLILGTAGWFAGILVLVLVFMLFSSVAFIGGPILLAAAWALFKVDREGAFVSQLALALSIAGQFLVVFWLGDSFSFRKDLVAIALVALILQAALIVVMPNSLHRTMSAFFAVIAWALLVRFALWDEAPFRRSSERSELPVGLAILGWAIVWLPVAGSLFVAIRREPEWMARGWQEIIRPAAVGLIVGLAVTTLLSQPFETMPWESSPVSQGGRVIWPLLSTFAALGALAAAYALGNRGLTAICVVAALLHVSHFYYALGTSLLTKSLTLVAIGVILLWTAHSMRSALPGVPGGRPP